MVHEAQWEKWAEKWHIPSLSEGLPCAGRNGMWSNGYSDEQRLNTVHLHCCLKRLHPMTYTSSIITQLPIKYTQRLNNYKISVNSSQKLKQATPLLMKVTKIFGPRHTLELVCMCPAASDSLWWGSCLQLDSATGQPLLLRSYHGIWIKKQQVDRKMKTNWKMKEHLLVNAENQLTLFHSI